MSGVTKHIFDQEVRDILSMWDCEIKTIQPLLPKEYSKSDIIALLKEFYPYEWRSVEVKYTYYQTKDRYIKRTYGKNRYDMKAPEVLLMNASRYKEILSDEYRHIHCDNYTEEGRILARENLWQKRKPKIERVNQKIEKALSKTQQVTPSFIDQLIGLYERKNTSQKDRRYILLELKKYYSLVTGKEDEIAAVHPSVKGVRDAQSSGAALVSFNAPAFCSYGREQNYNAPVGKYAAFAYTAALNHLLADSDHVQHIGDTTVVCWAEGADDAYPGFFSAVIGGGTYGGLSDNDLRAALKRLANGLPCDDLGVDPNRPFYILGLAPNAARLSVRFFLRDSFGKLMENVNAHYARLEIAGAKYSILPLWALLNATVRDPKKQVPSPVVSGATVRAVFSGTPYPVSLMEAVLLRIRAERNVTWERAAILKAYLAKNYERGSDHSMFSEVTSVQLNEDCNYMPYLLGRLFRVMEEIQLASMGWSVNRSIRDSYFNSAASTPRSVFGKLFSLSNYHLKKLMRDKPGLGKKLGDLESDLAARLTTPPPARFTQEETICFYLGYYHQCNGKKEEKENV